MSENSHFDLKKDRYSCVRVEQKHFAALTASDLASRLSASVPRWQQDGVRGVWAKINLKHSSFIPIFADNGFDFHHAQPGYVMMKRWLSATDPDNIPTYANQYLGAAGFVVNDDNQLLVVQERYSVKPHWKLPGGHANAGENIGEAAEREVLEETGVRAQFQCIVAFRHQHKYNFGCSDFYFICLLKPLTHTISPCQQEIAEAKWLDLEEYMSDPIVSDANRHFAECYVDMVRQGKYSLRPSEVLSYHKRGYDLIYSLQHNQHDSDSESETFFIDGQDPDACAKRTDSAVRKEETNSETDIEKLVNKMEKPVSEVSTKKTNSTVAQTKPDSEMERPYCDAGMDKPVSTTGSQKLFYETCTRKPDSQTHSDPIETTSDVETCTGNPVIQGRRETQL